MFDCQTKALATLADLTRVALHYDRFSLSKIALARTAELNGVLKRAAEALKFRKKIRGSLT